MGHGCDGRWEDKVAVLMLACTHDKTMTQEAELLTAVEYFPQQKQGARVLHDGCMFEHVECILTESMKASTPRRARDTPEARPRREETIRTAQARPGERTVTHCRAGESTTKMGQVR